MNEYSDFYSYFYDNCNVLQNKFGIRNEIALESVARDLSLVGMDELMNEPAPVLFDSSYLRHVHGVLFQNVYDWAGSFRTCEMHRNQTYCPPALIAERVDSFCANFQDGFMGKTFVDSADVAKHLTTAWAELNKIHPFRDGNGRSQYIFFGVACREKGYVLSAGVEDLKNLRMARDLASMGRPVVLRNLLSRSLSVVGSVESEVEDSVIIPSLSVDTSFGRVVEVPRDVKSKLNSKCTHDISDLIVLDTSSGSCQFEH